MPFVLKGSGFRRGMGQADPCACQYQLPGVTLIPNLPLCNPATGTAPSCTAAEGNAPFCAGIPYGQPGYAQCIANAAATTTVGAIGTPTPVSQSSYQAILSSLTPAQKAPAPSNTVSTPATPVSTPVQSNAPNQTTLGSSTPVQSNAPSTSYVTPVTAASMTGCFALFGSEPCIGPVGLYTLLAGLAATFGIVALAGHK